MPKRLAPLLLPCLVLLSSCSHTPPPESAERLALAGAAACQRYAEPDRVPACLAAVKVLTEAVREGLEHHQRTDAGHPD